MISHIIFLIILSISPFGEARVGIPYGILNGVPPVLAFLLGLGANLLVYPLMTTVVRTIDKKLWRFKIYKKQSLKLSKRARNIVGNTFEKYGFWGLMIFVMIPLPVTGAYMATIAAIIFKISHKKAFSSISIGVVISCLIVALTSYFGKVGFNSL